MRSSPQCDGPGAARVRSRHAHPVQGQRETCSSKVFGILNCCKGKGFPLIPGIQLLVALGCSREEMLLHQRDAQGLCAYVGTYCSSSFLGVCLTKKKVYCCFESKLSRILQEQGRQQLPKPWGKPKTEQCLGFTHRRVRPARSLEDGFQRGLRRVHRRRAPAR
jgi:hypothetical protein